MRLEICAEILVRSEPGPHHPFVCINRALLVKGQRPFGIQYVTSIIDPRLKLLHQQESNDAGDRWHCRSGQTGNSLRIRFAGRARLDYPEESKNSDGCGLSLAFLTRLADPGITAVLHFEMNTNRTMRNRPLGPVFATLAGLILMVGCEKTYEPAAYKAAPRVDAGKLSATGSAAGVNLPDITNWTSPADIRNAARSGSKNRGYSGMRSYRGIAGRGYSGLGRPYRGYAGPSGNFRGFGSQPGQYRGNSLRRNYRGRR